MDVNPKQWMDSRKFCMLMDDLAATWRNKKSSDEDKEFRLTALGLWFEAQEADVVDTKARVARPLSPPPAIAYEDPPESETMTPTEEARYARMADEAAAATVPSEEILRQVIKGYLKPAYNKGFRCFDIPMRWKGRAVSTSADRWKQCLEAEGIQANELVWVKDDRTWRAPAPLPGGSVPLVLV